MWLWPPPHNTGHRSSLNLISVSNQIVEPELHFRESSKIDFNIFSDGQSTTTLGQMLIKLISPAIKNIHLLSGLNYPSVKFRPLDVFLLDWERLYDHISLHHQITPLPLTKPSALRSLSLPGYCSFALNAHRFSLTLLISVSQKKMSQAQG